MDLLSDIISYVRRIIKAPSNAQITDNLIVDYINRFWIMDVDARIQLFDLKSKYQFETVPGIDQYNMPMYQLQISPGANPLQTQISYYPVYQGFMGPAYVNGVQVQMQTERNYFFNMWPNIVQQINVAAIGNGTSGPYTFTFPIGPNNTMPLTTPFQYLLRGHINTNGLIALANSTFGTYSDPPTVTNAQAIGLTGSIASTPVATVFPAVYITSNAADGSNIEVCDSGQVLTGNQNLGLLMSPGTYPTGNTALSNGYQTSFAITGATQATQAVLTVTTTFAAGQTVTINGVVGMTQLNGNTYTVVANGGTTLTINVNSTAFTAYVSGGTVSSFQNVINYYTGQVSNLYFPQAIPSGANINVQCFRFQTGLPRGILFYDNTLTFRSPPDKQYLVELDAYLTPAGFLATSQAIQFAYMCEYIARGAARKILADTGDIEQFQFYEPLFKEQESLVWKRSQRQFTASRTQTLYSQGNHQGYGGINNFGGLQ